MFLVNALIAKAEKVYLSAPPKIVIIDHDKKRTFELRKEGLPDVGKMLISGLHSTVVLVLLFCLLLCVCVCVCVYLPGQQRSHPQGAFCIYMSRQYTFFYAVVWNPWDRKAKTILDFGEEEYKCMLCVGAANAEKPITLRPGEEWQGRQEISVVPSSYSSGQWDPEIIHRIQDI